MGLLSKIKEQAALPPATMPEPPAEVTAPLQETTHLGRRAVLEEIDDDGHAWYRTSRESRGQEIVCFVRDVALNVEVPFDA